MVRPHKKLGVTKCVDWLVAGCMCYTLSDTTHSGADHLEIVTISNNRCITTLSAKCSYSLQCRHLSGSLPSLAALPRLKAILASNAAFSSTIPSMPAMLTTSDQLGPSESAFVVEQGTCVVNSTSKCVSNPNHPSTYDYSPCTIRVRATGYVTAVKFETTMDQRNTPNEIGIGDRLELNGITFTGLSGPDDELMTNGSQVDWNPGFNPYTGQPRLTGWARSWTICWSNQTSLRLETLSFSKNRLVGSTQSLENAPSLQTVILSNNYISCDAATLDMASSLGHGTFKDPGPEALHMVGEWFRTKYPYVNCKPPRVSRWLSLSNDVCCSIWSWSHRED